MIQIKAVILENSAEAEGIYRMVLKAPKIASQAKPGQFVHIRCGEGYPLLRRPFSVAEVPGCNEYFRWIPGSIGLLYKVVGKGTKFLSKLRVEDSLDIIGPLGRPFDLIDGKDKIILFVGGGMGIAPLSFLADRFSEMPYLSRPHYYLIYGEKTPTLKDYAEGLVPIDGFGFCSEDGSFGYPGLVTEFLEEILINRNQKLLKDSFYIDSEIPWKIDIVYACGPKAMLKEVARITSEVNIPCQVSLEANMACGMGACLGCVIKTKDGYKTVCKDGPVFDAKEVIWDET